MPLINTFYKDLESQLTDDKKSILELRDLLVFFKGKGIDKQAMEFVLENLRSNVPEKEDIILDLLDFVTGYCRPELAIF